MIELYHAVTAANSMVAGVERLQPDIRNQLDAPHSRAWLRRMEPRPAAKAALAMPNKVPETLRTFGG